MVHHPQSSGFTSTLPSRANAANRTNTSRARAGLRLPGPNTSTSVPGANTSASIPIHGPGSQTGLHRPQLPQAQRRCNWKRPAPTGFTLVELLIAVVIIGVLSGVAMPAFLGQQNKAKVNAANIQARGLMSYCLAHFIDNGKMPGSGDAEYQRLAEDPNHAIIKWEVSRADDKCSVNIEGNGKQLSRKGIFSIEGTGDATRIQATPAKV